MPIEILMPALSPTMKEGNLAKWNVKEGDEVSSGEVIAEIETDKATMEVEAVDEGVVGKIFVADGTQNVKVNQVIAILLEEGESKDSIKDYKPAEVEAEPVENKKDKPKKAEKSKKAPPKKPAPAPKAAPAKQASQIIESSSDSLVRVSPLARRIADEKGVDVNLLQGSGPSGRIIKQDVYEAVAMGAGGLIRRDDYEYTPIENNNMRRVIAQRLQESKQEVPHFYLSLDCNIDRLLEARADINADAPKNAEGKPHYKVSVNDLIIKASALALKKVPDANASWTDEAVLRYNNVDISVAVAIDGGLITPIIANADQKKVNVISSEMKDLAKRAKLGTLAPEEFQGGGFSISNLGMFGIKNFNAIINPPQGAILSVGAGEKRAIVENDQLKIATVMTVSLSCDHRVVDGAVGAMFLNAFKGYIEKPVTMFI